MRKLKNIELKRLSPEDFRRADKSPFVIILDNVRSLNNIGSIFRTADAFLIEKIYLCGITATPPHKDIHKTALGSTESVEWEYFKNTIDAISTLKGKGFTLIAVEQTTGSVSLEDFRVDPEKSMLLFLDMKCAVWIRQLLMYVITAWIFRSLEQNTHLTFQSAQE